MAQVVECLPSKGEAPSSHPSFAKIIIIILYKERNPRNLSSVRGRFAYVYTDLIKSFCHKKSMECGTRKKTSGTEEPTLSLRGHMASFKTLFNCLLRGPSNLHGFLRSTLCRAYQSHSALNLCALAGFRTDYRWEQNCSFCFKFPRDRL
jgi:hypothetical protein